MATGQRVGSLRHSRGFRWAARLLASLAGATATLVVILFLILVPDLAPITGFPIALIDLLAFAAGGSYLVTYRLIVSPRT